MRRFGGGPRGVSDRLPLYPGLPHPMAVIAVASGPRGGQGRDCANPIDSAIESSLFILADHLLQAPKAFVRIPLRN